MKNFIFILLIFYPYFLFSQFNVKPEVSFGVNKANFIGHSFGRNGVKEILPTHSFSSGLLLEYKLSNNDISFSSGISVLNQPIVYILDGEYLNAIYPNEVLTYESFRKKEIYWFIDLPIWISKTYKSGISISGGVNFKFYQPKWREIDFLLYYYEFKKCTTGLLLAFGYDFKNNLSLKIKTNIEYPGFIKEEFFDEIHLVQNINTMLSLSYRFNFNKREKN